MAELKVGARELKAHWGRYVNIVKQGGSVTLTEWGRPVARLVPVAGAGGEPPLDKRLQALVASGKLIHGGGARPRPRQPEISLRGGRMLSELIVEERDTHPRASIAPGGAGDPVP